MKPLALFEGKLLWRAWESLLDSIRTGKTGAALAGFEDSFQQMAEVGAVARTFNEAMVALTRLVTPAVLAAYDFSGISKLMDVGGGYGELLSAILTAHPDMRGGIFDLAHCADGARKRLHDAGVHDRCEFIAGNFFEVVPTGWDACILKSIIHDWNDERSRTILSNCRRALNERGKVLLVERIMPETLEPTAEHRMATLSDLNMLRGPGGSERTEPEFRALLRDSGFELTRVLPAGPMHVIEAACA
ncbi:MAG TPA: methyltransferase [Candidatus Margulisiibacteriota bacterium]|nr:methyltransferase [Candidatus Margulisiibacteriota bacterium]